MSGRIEHLGRSCIGGALYEDARREIHRAECNCAYWHGVFGGIYLPHLRQAVQEHTIRAEALADRLQHLPDEWVAEMDGSEIRFRSPSASLAVDLEQDGDIVEIAWRPRPFQFAGVIARRPEAYHAALLAGEAAAAGGDDAPDTIHGAIQLKEAGLANLVQYDARPRSASQEWILPADPSPPRSSLRDVLSGAEIARFRLAGPEPLESSRDRAGVELRAFLSTAAGNGAPARSLRKRIRCGPGVEEFQVALDARLSEGEWLVSEWNLGLLTPDAPGRRLVLKGDQPGSFAPGSRGAADRVSTLRLEDTEWLRLAITLTFEPSARVEWAPVETVSLSESGVERIYQGTSFLLGWRAGGDGARASIDVRLEETSRDS